MQLVLKIKDINNLSISSCDQIMYNTLSPPCGHLMQLLTFSLHAFHFISLYLVKCLASVHVMLLIYSVWLITRLKSCVCFVFLGVLELLDPSLLYSVTLSSLDYPQQSAAMTLTEVHICLLLLRHWYPHRVPLVQVYSLSYFKPTPASGLYLTDGRISERHTKLMSNEN